MESIQAKGYQVVFEGEGYADFNTFIQSQNYSMAFVLVDSNTHEHCLARFLSNFETTLTIEVIEIDPGEENKNIETCMGVWEALSELDGDRKSLMINLGGGVITDLGGFIACTFKRGIDYINIPTTLLSMVDASVGGKTGVDLGNLKNQIGVISNPKMVLIDPYFLETLALEEIRSGYAEMLKHGLIADAAYWEEISTKNYKDKEAIAEAIPRSIAIKNEVVLEDPYEQGLRKTLNFGHTLGHAIESYFLVSEKKTRLLHGEAIAVGMILALFLSGEILDFPKQSLLKISKRINTIYNPVRFTTEDIKEIIELLKFDKKNSHGRINFVLLNDIAKPKIDVVVSNDLIYESFNFYQNL